MTADHFMGWDAESAGIPWTRPPREGWRKRIEAADHSRSAASPRLGMGAVTDFLQAWDKLYEMNGLDPKRADWKYRDLMDLINKEGRPYVYSPELPKGVKRGRMKECFMNASQAAISHRDLFYVEGYATGIIPVHHAWVTKDLHTAIEVTWEDATDYHGIAFNTAWLRERMLKTGYYGVFQGMSPDELDWLIEGLPREAIVR